MKQDQAKTIATVTFSFAKWGVIIGSIAVVIVLYLFVVYFAATNVKCDLGDEAVGKTIKAFRNSQTKTASCTGFCSIQPNSKCCTATMLFPKSPSPQNPFMFFQDCDKNVSSVELSNNDVMCLCEF
jgi:hypothetical protein